VAGEHPDVRVQEQDFDVASLQQELLGEDCQAGAVASFTGLVRRDNELREVGVLELEHYPAMTEKSIQKIVDEAKQRWHVQRARVVHRVGRLRPGEQIVYVGVSSSHRGDAFQACEFIMDYLKTRAPFWKKETGADGTHWVESRDSDHVAARRWQD
jgi:molybdopterin synthase catalytic subunit